MPIVAGEKFELRLIRHSDILLHEESEDDRRARLAKRFKEEKVLYNPLIVGRYKNRYILIDGANRFEALKSINCKLVLAQIVDYLDPAIQLKSWFHFVNGISIDDLIEYLTREKLWYEYTVFNSKFRAINEIIIRDKTGKTLRIKLARSLNKMLTQLSSLNNFYESAYNYTRIDSDTEVKDMNQISPYNGLLFMYPRFSKENIINISMMKQKLPAGITRHLIPNRVLHIKYPIKNLKSSSNLDAKNSELMSFIIQKVNSKKVRLYKEPLLIFDEY
ncbi:MAG TPA: ParB N-terminal domain-containing protein [Ignavibacteria bacterium]|jgi:hypothetical protein